MALLNRFRNRQGFKLPKGLTGQIGFALIAVISLLFIVIAVVLLSLSTSDTDRKIAANNLGNTQAYYSAEAGIAHAMATLAADTLWRAGYNNDTVGNASYSVQVIDSTMPGQSKLQDSLILHATGFADGSESRIDVLLRRKKSTFQDGIFGDSAVDIGGNALINAYNSDSGSYTDSTGGMGGGVGSNGKITIKGTSDIYGNVYTPDTVRTTGAVNVYGTTSSSAPPTTLEPISQADMDYARLNSNAPAGLTMTGGASYDPTTQSLTAGGNGATVTFTSGIYYFSDIKFTSQAQIVIDSGAKVIIFMTGELDAAGGTIANTSQKAENFQIYSTGPSISLTGSEDLYATIYAPNAHIKLAGDGNFYGSLIGKSIAMPGGAQVHYDRSLLNAQRVLRGKYAKAAWHVL